MKATDDGYPSIILGHKVDLWVVMIGSLNLHVDVLVMFPTECDGYQQTGWKVYLRRRKGYSSAKSN